MNLKFQKDNLKLKGTSHIYDKCDILLINSSPLLYSAGLFLLPTSYRVKMKRKGLKLAPFPISSPNFYNSGNFHFLCLSPLPFLSVCRNLGTKPIKNCNSREKMKLQLGNTSGLDDALSLYKDMISFSLCHTI